MEEEKETERKNIFNETINCLNKRPLSSAKFSSRPRPKTGITKLPLMKQMNYFNENKEEFIKKDELDPLYLMIKNSPTKYDMKSVNKKYRKMTEIYLKKLKYQNDFNKTDEVFFKYNVLYGNKNGNIIRNYSPKMRPISVSNKTAQKEDINDSKFKCFTKEEVQLLFLAKTEDLKIKLRDNLESKFQEYCSKNCVDRIADFSESNLAGNFAYTISEILKYNDKISRLYFSKNCFGDEGVKMLMSVLENSLEIIHIDLSSNDITFRGAEYIFSTLLKQHSIISLDLSSKEGINRNRLSHEGMRLMEEVLKVNKLLEYLYLSGNSIKNEGLKYILLGLKENKTLNTLHIAHNEINSQGIGFFKSILVSTKLMDLDISENAIGNDGIEIISEIINENQIGHLKRLNVSNCKIDFNGFYQMVFALENNKRLEVLNFSKNSINSKNFAILKPNLVNINVRELILVKCKIGNNGSKVIGEILAANNSIKVLNISDNRIDDRGFKSFEELPAKNHGIEVINVSKNFITDCSAKNFMKNLESNYSIKKINFYDNQLKNESGTIILESLRTNSNILSVNVKYNRIQIRVLDEIKKLLKQNRENYKMKYVPRLKNEIRNNFVTDNDFFITNEKIEETGISAKNLNEKLKEDIDKYAKLKKEEETKINEIKERNENINTEHLMYEENTKKIYNDMVNIKENSQKEQESINKEITGHHEKIRNLELKQRDLKIEQDKIKFQFEYEVNKVQTELKQSEERLNLAILSSDSLKKELEEKKKALDAVLNPPLQPKMSISGSSFYNKEAQQNNLKKSTNNLVNHKKSDVESINNDQKEKDKDKEHNNADNNSKNHEKDKDSKEKEKDRKSSNNERPKTANRAKSAAPKRNIKSAGSRSKNSESGSKKNSEKESEKEKNEYSGLDITKDNKSKNDGKSDKISEYSETKDKDKDKESKRNKSSTKKIMKTKRPPNV